MEAILAVTVPFFALVLCGWGAAHRGLLPESAIPGLNAFVLYFALPCMLLRLGMRTPVVDLLDPIMLGLWLGVAVVVVGASVGVALRQGITLQNAAFGGLVSSFPNSGFMGVPLLIALLGPEAAGPVMCMLLADTFVTTSACLAVAQSHRSQGQGWSFARLRQVLSTPLSNPQPWAIALGALMSGLQWRLPQPVDVMVTMLAQAAAPVALFTIGAVLWRSQARVSRRTPWAHVLPAAGLKLFVHPALIWLACQAAVSAGLQLSTLQVTALTLCAALPSASNVSLLAERYGADNGRVARIILASTTLAFLSFSALAWLFGVQPQG